MSKPAQRFIIDTEAGRLVPAFNTLSGTTTPAVYVGDTVPVEIYLVRQPGPGAGLVSQGFPAGATVRMAVGSVNASPTSGTWVIGYGANSTAPLAYNISAGDLQTALNGLASVAAAGGVTVDKVAAQYRIAWNSNGVRSPFSQGADTLVPASDIQQQILQVGSVSQPEIVLVNLAMRPIAYTDTFTSLDPVAGSHSGTGYQISGPAAGGGYRLQVSYGQNGVTSTVWTDTIPLSAGSQAISQIIYNALVNEGWGFVSDSNPTVNSWGLSVTLLGANDYRVDFVAPEFTTPVSVVLPTIVGLDVSQVTAYDGKKAVLGMNTVEAVAFLGTKDSIRGVLEVEVEAAGEVQTVLQASCTILGQVISDGVYSTIPLGTLLTEADGDSRYLRRDADQATDPSSLNQIWENVTGQTAVAGVDIAGAIANADAPSAANPFAVASDVQTFDQSLNTIDAVSFAGVTAGAGGFTSSAESDLSGGIRMVGAGMDTTFKFDEISFQGNPVLTPTTLSLGSTFLDSSSGLTGINYINVASGTVVLDLTGVTLGATGVIYFADASVQETRVVRENQANGSAFTVGGFDTVHYPYEVKVIDNTGIAYWVPARLA